MKQITWWQSGVIYQVYPRSFQDSNGDGVGDIPGVIARLPYLVDLGIDAIWLSPVFPSPMADFGYDIADYTDIDPLFGTLADMDRLIAEAHARGIRIILDLVPNHTSIEHAWFKESRSSRTNPKRDWYIWRDAAPDGGPPNNWLSEFGGSGWELDAASGQYYFHTFLFQQPDLNWRNPDVPAAIHDAMRFWFRRGVDGFRVDAVWYVIKDEQFRDNPPNPNYTPKSPPNLIVLPVYTADRPEMENVIAEMRRVSDEFPDRLLIGELYLPIERLMAYYGRDLTGVHLPFNFSLLTAAWNAESLARLIREYNDALPPGGWPNWVLGNHDRPRIAGRIGSAQVRNAAMLLLTLHGTPTIYNGDEIGMEQAQIARANIRDPVELNVPGYALGRDGCRTPMQWDAGNHAGFSSAQPWLPITRDYDKQNVVKQRADDNSLLQFYRTLIALRRSNPVLIEGIMHSIRADRGVLIFAREHLGKRVVVALNLADEAASPDIPECHGLRILLSTTKRDSTDLAGPIELSPNEGVVFVPVD